MKRLKSEEALEILNDMKVKIEIPKAAVTQYKRNAALDMAIEALKCSEIPNCSDCISRQAAIDEITEYGSGDTICMSVGELRRRIEHLPPAQQEPKWIPCSERLPEKSGQYYVSGGDKVWICEFLIIQNFIGGWCNDVANPVVQAWMPLPEPWKGGQP